MKTRLNMVFFTIFSLSLMNLKGDIANGDFLITQDPEPPKNVFRIGDLVQVDIIESSESRFKEKESGNKSTEWTAKLAKWIRLSSGRTRDGRGRTEKVLTLKPAALNEPEIDFESEIDVENESKDDRSSLFKEKIMCMVKDIRPNGNVFVEGVKEVREDKKFRKLIFSGEVSRKDLETLESIPSFRVYDPNIEIIETGPHKDAVNRTLLQKFLQVIWPF